MIKKLSIKFFAVLSLFVFMAVASFARSFEINNIEKITIEPIRNNTCTLNMYFDSDYSGKAFIQKIANGAYTVYLPEAAMKNKKIKTIYRNKYDKKLVRFHFEQKTYKQKNNDSNYVKITVQMSSDYNLRLLSKNIAEEGFVFFTQPTFDASPFILIAFGLVLFFMIRKFLDILETKNNPTSYTTFPKSFKIPQKQPELIEKEMFKRNLNYVRKIKDDIKQNLKMADSSSFDCFKIKSENKESINNNINEINTNIKQKQITNDKLQTNPITKKEQTETVKINTDILSNIKLSDTTGFYIKAENNEAVLYGYSSDNTFELKRFKDLSVLNLQARFYDKNGENDIYIVRIDSYKAMVEFTSSSIRELAVL